MDILQVSNDGPSVSEVNAQIAINLFDFIEDNSVDAHEYLWDLEKPDGCMVYEYVHQSHALGEQSDAMITVCLTNGNFVRWYFNCKQQSAVSLIDQIYHYGVGIISSISFRVEDMMLVCLAPDHNDH